jgi:predicted ATPase
MERSAVHLRTVRFDAKTLAASRAPTCHLPAMRSVDQIEFVAPITLFAGENGSGKSTLIEAIAWAADLLVVGLDRSARSLPGADALGEALRLAWSRRVRRGFLFRAEDFYGFISAAGQNARDLKERARRVRESLPDATEGERNRVASPYEGSARALDERYGHLDSASHGQQFVHFLKSRLVRGGLYLLDEPEAPLSPMSQLSLLSLLMTTAAELDAQFVVATHSPILLACPGAAIFTFDEAPLRRAEFSELSGVSLMRDFLARPEAFLRHL